MTELAQIVRLLSEIKNELAQMRGALEKAAYPIYIYVPQPPAVAYPNPIPLPAVIPTPPPVTPPYRPWGTGGSSAPPIPGGATYTLSTAPTPPAPVVPPVSEATK